MQKAWEKIVWVNTIILVLAAICCGTGYWLGSFLFVYTSSIGFADSAQLKNWHGIIINASFLALNLFFSGQYLCGLFN